ncbi:MAG: precorrin-3B synthase [Alsobacter sp.]
MSLAPRSLVRGWCPGALRPMQTGDGLLVRLRITGGILSAELARSLSEASGEYGNGLIDLSARGNLQVRGVTETTLGPLSERLTALGVLDEDPAAEAVRNVVASPLAGLDPAAVLDIRPLVQRLEQVLVRDEDLHALPGKFGFAVDDGGRIGLDDVSADVSFRAVHRAGRTPVFLIALAGMRRDEPVAACEADALPEAAAALARAFLTLRDDAAGQARRMRDLVGRVGARRVFAAAGLETGAPSETRSVRPASEVFGLPETLSGVALGVAAPFGRWTAEDLFALAGVADSLGVGDLRLTPYRAILVPRVAQDRAEGLRREWSARFIVSADDPRLAVAACPGMPACGNATTHTHDDALALAPLARSLAPAGLALHVSGCPKGCAHPGAAPLTLVGVDGAYDLVARGSAADPPLRRGLAVGDVAALLAEQDRTGKECSA